MSSYKQQVEEAKRSSVAQLLFRCARLLNGQAVARLRERSGQEGLRVVHTRLFPHIDLEGTRLTELAKRLEVSKQAASQWVDELSAMGVLEKVADPSDGRARLIRFSQEGQTGLLAGLALLRDVEGELAQEFGVVEMEQLHGLLLRLLPILERREEEKP